MTRTAIQQRLFYGLENKKNTCYTKVIPSLEIHVIDFKKKKKKIESSEIKNSI